MYPEEYTTPFVHNPTNGWGSYDRSKQIILNDDSFTWQRTK
jgi:hypothetical protein